MTERVRTVEYYRLLSHGNRRVARGVLAIFILGRGIVLIGPAFVAVLIIQHWVPLPQSHTSSRGRDSTTTRPIHMTRHKEKS